MELQRWNTIISRVERLARNGKRVDTHSVVGAPFPLYVIDVPGAATATQTVLVTAGLHGDEPAGVEAALAFAELSCRDWARDFHFCILPCVNPTGFAMGTRENAQGVDLNRAFGGRDSMPEVRLVKQLASERRIHLAVDLHEDWEAKGFYLYECVRYNDPLGGRIAEHVGRVCPLDVYGDGDLRISPGVFQVSSACGATGLVPFALSRTVTRGVIFETPTGWEMARRVAAHHTALNAFLACTAVSEFPHVS